VWKKYQKNNTTNTTCSGKGIPQTLAAKRGLGPQMGCMTATPHLSPKVRTPEFQSSDEPIRLIIKLHHGSTSNNSEAASFL
jgi:hypothetical protein